MPTVAADVTIRARNVTSVAVFVTIPARNVTSVAVFVTIPARIVTSTAVFVTSRAWLVTSTDFDGGKGMEKGAAMGIITDDKACLRSNKQALGYDLIGYDAIAFLEDYSLTIGRYLWPQELVCISAFCILP